MDIQMLLNAKMSEWALERSRSMVTLGELISELSHIDKALPLVVNDHEEGVVKPADLISYRGYYSDLAIDCEKDGRDVTVGEFGTWLMEAIGKTYTGYKGGDFVMSKITPMWVDHVGDCRNIAVVGVEVIDGVCCLHTARREEDYE